MKKKWLLDTNVLSEPGRPRPDPAVLAWLRAEQADWMVPAVVLAERYAGTYGPDARRGAATREALDAFRADWPDLIAEFDGADAAAWGACVSGRERQPGGAVDRLIGAQALARGLAVVTRNLADFPGVPRLNPWTGASEDLAREPAAGAGVEGQERAGGQ